MWGPGVGARGSPGHCALLPPPSSPPGQPPPSPVHEGCWVGHPGTVQKVSETPGYRRGGRVWFLHHC